MKASTACIALIKQFEGCSLKAYKCPAGVLTIGYGHTKGVKEGQTITQAQTEAYLLEDMAKFEKHVMLFDSVYHWNQNEFDALVSFSFNVGSINQLTKSKKRTKKEIAAAITSYNKSNGKVLAGLAKRRAAEKELFLKPLTEKETKEGDTVEETKKVEVKKIPIIVNGTVYEIDGIFENGFNYVSIRQLANLLNVEVSAAGSTPVLTTK